VSSEYDIPGGGAMNPVHGDESLSDEKGYAVFFGQPASAFLE